MNKNCINHILLFHFLKKCFQHSLVVLIVFLSSNIRCIGQNKYWVFFNDKGSYDTSRTYVTSQTVFNRNALFLPAKQYSDVPLWPDYLAVLRKMGLKVECHSKWLNGVTAIIEDQGIVCQLLDLPFIKEVRRCEPILSANLACFVPEKDLQFYAVEQMQGAIFGRHGLSGRNVAVGVVDGNFYQADKSDLLHHLFDSARIVTSRDFVDPSVTSFFNNYKGDFDRHGTDILEMIAGRKGESTDGFGLAPDANFYLARTDDTEREFRGEEDYWVSALEWLDSLGVRLVNSSVGYSIDFDLAEENHHPSEMDGKTTVITRAANVACKEKGMIIVCSAGNDGENSDWRVVSAPADAQRVISVGTTDFNWMKTSFSAVGPESLGYVKPDVACFSTGGTSFSAPMITGFIACLLQGRPSLTLEEISMILRRSSHLSQYPNRYLGFGVPDSKKALMMLKGPTDILLRPPARHSGSFDLRKDFEEGESVVVFHKSDRYTVVSQERLSVLKNNVIEAPEGVKWTTITNNKKTVEIYWR